MNTASVPPNPKMGGPKKSFGPLKRNLRGQTNDFGGTNDLEFEGTKMTLGGPKEFGQFGPHKRNLRGQNNDFGGTKRVFGPHKRNLRGQTNDFGGTNDLEFEGTKQ